MLVSPQFLFRGIPTSGKTNTGAVVPIDDFALATRLSYFLWGSTPDDELLQTANKRALHDPTTLRAEFERLLADPRSAALFDGFVSQWLHLGKLGSATPDPQLFPQFNEDMRQAMLDEVRLFFNSIRERDGSALEIINGKHTFANAGTAVIYGVT